MAKTRRTITALLPGYQCKRYRWRRRILANILQASKKARVKYESTDRFEVVVLLYLTKGKRHDIHDVYNRLKDILDALQGRFGGSKTIHSKHRLIQNDRQVCRVVIEKQPIPKSLSDDAGGRLLVRLYERQVAIAEEQGRPIFEASKEVHTRLIASDPQRVRLVARQFKSLSQSSHI